MATERLPLKKEQREGQRELLLRLLAQEGIVPAERGLARMESADQAPLSYAQKRLWFLDRLHPGNHFYNVVLSFRLEGRLVIGALQRSLQELVRRHGALRTRFLMEDGEPVQKIERDVQLPLPQIDLDGEEAEEDRRLRAGQIVVEEGRKAFDLGQAPLLRVVLVRIGEEEHVLGLSIHHIVFDEWSLGVLQRELGVLYQGYVCAEEAPIQEMPVQYVEYAAWQREWSKSELFEQQLAYWKEQLAGMPRELELATDHLRLAMPLTRDGVSTRVVGRELWEGLKDVSRRESATLFMTLLAAYEVLLLRYTGQEDFGVGTPVANRNHVQSEEVVGCCVNTLVIRAQLGGRPSFREVLARTRKTALEGFGHQDLPIEKLVEELAPARDLSRTPLFQVMFTVRSELKPREDIGGVQISLAGVDANVLCDLTLMISDYEAPTLTLNYDADLFEPATVERILDHYVRLLGEIVACAGQAVWAMPLLSDREERQLREWNKSETEYPRDKSIAELFAEHAGERGEDVAVVFGKEQITYRDLDQRSNQLAHYLRSLGVGVESLVGIYAERSLEMAIALLGIEKAGGAYVPLDVEYPQERVRFMLEDTGLSVVLTQERRARQLPQGIHQVCLDRDWSEIARHSDQSLSTGSRAENLAYVMYTSGSTGAPKAVMVSQKSLVRLLRGTNYIQFKGDEVVAQCCNTCFDPATFEIWGALLSGGRLVVIPNEILLDANRLAAEILRQGVEVMFLATALFNELAQRSPEIFVPVKYLLFGGEAANVGAVKAVLAQGGTGRLVNLYGPAECTTFTSWYVANPLGKAAKNVPIGRPVANTKLYVLDQEMNLAPVGVAGELYVGGEGVGRGYWRRPELTAERFVPDPFSAEPGARLYRTGDRAKWPADGQLEFLGRADNQVKIRGFRVELGEIETALRQHEGVRDCAVIVLKHGQDRKRLVAYVAGEAVGDELRKYLKSRLPEYMVPSVFVRMAELPLNANGKVDRNALSEAAGEQMEPAGLYEAPRTPVEELLARIWATVLERERVGVQDNFFEVGGHSLLAMLIATRVQQALQIDVPVRALFEFPTIAQLARELEPRLQKPEKDVDGISLTQGSTKNSAVQLSYAQERLWFLDQLQPGSDFYNVPMVFAVHGALDQALLQRSLQEVVRRHGALRTRFEVLDGIPVQKIEDEVIIPLPIVDLREFEEDQERRAQARQLVNEEGRKPFDLGKVPLMRNLLIRLSQEEHVLGLTMHHIVCDDWSLGVLWQEVATLYKGYLRGEDKPLKQMPVQYADYAVWQRRWLQGERLERQMDYWRGQLEGMPAVLDLVTDRPRPATQSFSGGVEEWILGPKLWEGINILNRRENATSFMTLLAAYEVLLLRYTGQEDFAVGSVLANRNRGELEGVIGFFVNAVVMRARLNGRPSFREVLRRVKKTALEGFEHEDLPFERLVEELAPERDVSRTPLFQAVFTMRNAPTRQKAFGGLSFSELESEIRTSKFDLTLIAEEGGQTGKLTLNYNSDLFERDSIRRMLVHYERLLEGIVADPDQGIWNLPMLTAAEEAELDGWNQARFGLSCEKNLVELFTEQALLQPERLAVAWENEQITYGDLERRSNQLGHYLRRAGVGREARVGIFVENSIDGLVAALGILKAGAACVPLTRVSPAKALCAVMADAAVSVVVTQEELRKHLPSTESRLVCLDREGSEMARQSDSRPQALLEPENLAFVLYQEGTAQPRGVMLRHAGLMNLALWYQSEYCVSPADHVAQLSEAASPDSAICSCLYLACGATLHLGKSAIFSSGHQLLAWLRQQEITIASLTGDAGAVLIALADQVRGMGLRLVIVQNHRLKNIPSDTAFQILTLHGRLENTAIATRMVASPTDEGFVIGRPIPNAETYVLDWNLQRTAIGIPGELWIAGAGLARGYHNQAGLTAERFVPNPFSREPGARMVRTGIRARYRKDGTIEQVGRVDDRLEMLGIEIEPSEIEAVLETHECVKKAAVAMRTDDKGNRRLAAYVVAHERQLLEKDELRAYLEQRLPAQFVPGVFVPLPDLPQKSNGEPDRRALSAIGEVDLVNQQVSPRTELEKVIATHWQEVLGLKTVGVHDNFFDCGGHSLLIIDLHRRLSAALAVDLEIIHLFQFPTIDSLSGFLQAGYNVSKWNRSVQDRAGRQKVAIQKLRKIQPTWTGNLRAE